MSLDLKPKELKAWSLNLGHDHVQTSLVSYCHLDDTEKAAVMSRIAERRQAQPDDRVAQLKALVAAL